MVGNLRPDSYLPSSRTTSSPLRPPAFSPEAESQHSHYRGPAVSHSSSQPQYNSRPQTPPLPPPFPQARSFNSQPPFLPGPPTNTTQYRHPYQHQAPHSPEYYQNYHRHFPTSPQTTPTKAKNNFKMLGMNPHIGASGAHHPFHSMLQSGLHAAHAAAAAAAAAAASNNSTSLPPHPPPPISKPSSLPPAIIPPNVFGATGGGSNGPSSHPHPLNNVPINMWPFIYNHIQNLLPQLSIAKMDPMSQVFCLRWNNHRNNLLTVFDQLLQTEAFCDVTLACDSTSIKCHKMILSACSSYFQQLFMENKCDHPIVFLKDIKYGEIRTILDYMYKGEVNVAQEELPGLLKVAELLKVKGLVEEEREKLLKNANRDTDGGDRGRSSHVSTSLEGGDDDGRERSSSSTSNKVSIVEEPRGIRRSLIPERERAERIAERERALLERDLQKEREHLAKERERLRVSENNRLSDGNRVASDSRERAERSDVISRESAKGNGEGISPTANGDSRSERSNMPPFMYTPPPGAPHFPMFPIPGFSPGIAAHIFGRASSGGNQTEGHNGEHHMNDKDGSPSPQGSAKRKKVASGSGGSSSSKESGIANIVTAGSHDREGNEEYTAPADISQLDQEKFDSLSATERENILASLPPGIDKNRIADYVPNQRLEWKRYKQYTRTDIMAAIEEVKKGMSALQAARKYGVPSRTLYDKVKKMGITTGRQIQRKSLPQYPAAFPRFGTMNLADREAYKDMDDRDDNSNDNTYGGPGDMDGRATMVPPSGFSTLHMLNIMKEMKENERSGKGDHGGEMLGLRPMNLSTMLSNAGSRDLAHVVSKRNSDSSLSPRSPPGMDHDSRDDIVDPRMNRDHEMEDDIAERDELDRGRPGPDSSGGVSRGERHLSGDIRAQFMADLRRLGGNIPTQSNEIRSVGEADARSDHQAATSTTISPPPLSKISHPPREFPSPTGTSPSKRTASSEDNLPPRKRKVSQEHHMAQLSQETVISNNGQRSPHTYNGLRGNEGESGGSATPPPHAKSTGSSADSEESATPVGSPEKSSERMIKEDPPSSSQGLECTN